MTYPAPPPPPAPPSAAPAAPWYRKTGVIIAAVAILALLIGTGIGSSTQKTKNVAGPTVTVPPPPAQTVTETSTAPAPPAVTETLKPTVIKTIATRTRTVVHTYTPAPKPAVSDGVYKVGSDINPGEWHTSGGNDCYYSINGDANGNNIIANGDSTGPQFANVNSGQYLELSGGCDWRHV